MLRLDTSALLLESFNGLSGLCRQGLLECSGQRPLERLPALQLTLGLQLRHSKEEKGFRV